jgi:20S proteasome alpha/beta subunit
VTFIITLYVNEGIVMASDSRLTLSRKVDRRDQFKANTQQILMDIVQSDSNYKCFLAPNDVGIMTCGDASVEGVPLAGYIEAFIDEQITQVLGSPIENDELTEGPEVDQVAERLLQYFRKMKEPPDTAFHVAGYKTEGAKRVQQVWRISVQGNEKVLVNTGEEKGVLWDGEGDIMYRLLQPLYRKKDSGEYEALDNPEIAFQFFTLQDAVDFAVYAVRSTVDSIRFLAARSKTVGGPIDVLVIKPREAFWVQRKKLQAG